MCCYMILVVKKGSRVCKNRLVKMNIRVNQISAENLTEAVPGRRGKFLKI